jgi:hypothetical protein
MLTYKNIKKPSLQTINYCETKLLKSFKGVLRPKTLIYHEKSTISRNRDPLYSLKSFNDLKVRTK